MHDRVRLLLRVCAAQSLSPLWLSKTLVTETLDLLSLSGIVGPLVQSAVSWNCVLQCSVVGLWLPFQLCGRLLAKWHNCWPVPGTDFPMNLQIPKDRAGIPDNRGECSLC